MQPKQIEDLLAEHQAQIEALNVEYRAALAEKQAQYEVLIRDLTHRQQMLVKSHQAELAAERQRLESQIVQLQHELDKIKRSRGWRFVLFIRRVSNWLLPHDSSRRRYAKRIGRTLVRSSYEQMPASSPVQAALPTPAPPAALEIPPTPRILEDAPFWRYHASTPDYEHHNRVHDPTVAELHQQIMESRDWTDAPTFSIITPVYKPPLDVFKDALESVRGQTYENWEWCVADASPDETIWRYLQQQATEDPRIKPIRVIENTGISGNSNVALKAAEGDYVVLLDHDDAIAPHALYEMAQVLRRENPPDLIYSDEDKLDERGYRCDPFFKPDWSPEMMLCVNLITHLCAIRREVVAAVGYFDPQADGAQDWDLFLRVSAYTQHIHHIPRVLYHWRKSAQSTSQALDNKSNMRETQRWVVLRHLQQQGMIEPQVFFTDPSVNPLNAMYPLVTWQQRETRRVSIVIPSIDHADVLGACLHSIFDLTTYPNFEVILVDTGSKEPETFSLYEQFQDEDRFRVVNYAEKFNFSRACNFGAGFATGDLLLFLNNDTKVLHNDWLDLMAQWFEQEGVGIVGPKLLYPDGRLQHAGVIVGIGGLASHVFITLPEDTGGIYGSPNWYRNYLSVTGACLMISDEAYNAVGGFDEGYKLNYSDVELCIRVHEAGYRIVYTPHVRLLHFESVTHGSRIPRADFLRATEHWRHWLKTGDPYFNPNLSYNDTLPRLKMGDYDTSQQSNERLMQLLPDKEIVLLPDDIIEAASRA